MHLFNGPRLRYRTANVGLLVAAKIPCLGLGLEGQVLGLGLGLEGLVLVNISGFGATERRFCLPELSIGSVGSESRLRTVVCVVILARLAI